MQLQISLKFEFQPTLLHLNQNFQTKTVERVKQRFVEEGFDECMDRKPYPRKGPIKTDGDFEAYLIALSCSEAPEGYADSISHETVRQVLKKTKSNRGGSKVG